MYKFRIQETHTQVQIYWESPRQQYWRVLCWSSPIPKHHGLCLCYSAELRTWETIAVAGESHSRGSHNSPCWRNTDHVHIKGMSCALQECFVCCVCGFFCFVWFSLVLAELIDIRRVKFQFLVRSILWTESGWILGYGIDPQAYKRL